jgi:hypothetical protein
MAHAPSLAEQIADVEAALTYLQQQERFRGQEQLVADTQAQLALLKSAQTRESAGAIQGMPQKAPIAARGRVLSLEPRSAA